MLVSDLVVFMKCQKIKSVLHGQYPKNYKWAHSRLLILRPKSNMFMLLRSAISQSNPMQYLSGPAS